MKIKKEIPAKPVWYKPDNGSIFTDTTVEDFSDEKKSHLRRGVCVDQEWLLEQLADLENWKSVKGFIALRKQINKPREDALDELAKLDQELGLDMVSEQHIEGVGTIREFAEPINEDAERDVVNRRIAESQRQYLEEQKDNG